MRGNSNIKFFHKPTFLRKEEPNAENSTYYKLEQEQAELSSHFINCINYVYR